MSSHSVRQDIEDPFVGKSGYELKCQHAKMVFTEEEIANLKLKRRHTS